MAEDKKEANVSYYRWSIILTFLIFGLLASTIAIMILSSQTNNADIKPIDVVLWEHGRNRTYEQIRRIAKYMPFISNIWVMKNTNLSPSLSNDDIQKWKDTWPNHVQIYDVPDSINTHEKAFFEIRKISTLNSMFIFMSDTTWPVRSTSANQWFFGRQQIPRMFGGLLRPNPFNSSLFDPYFESTAPVMVVEQSILNRDFIGKSLNQFMLYILMDNVSLRQDLNHDLLLTNDQSVNVDQLSSGLCSYFETVHWVPPSTLSSTDINTVNQQILDYLASKSIE